MQCPPPQTELQPHGWQLLCAQSHAQLAPSPLPDVVWCGRGGMVWHGMVWCGVVGCGRGGGMGRVVRCVWYGMVWHGVVSYVWYYMVWSDRYDMIWYGMVWYGMVWHGKCDRYARYDRYGMYGTYGMVW